MALSPNQIEIDEKPKSDKRVEKTQDNSEDDEPKPDFAEMAIRWINHNPKMLCLVIVLVSFFLVFLCSFLAIRNNNSWVGLTSR